VEQWCHDIDQLIIIAMNTPPHGGWWPNHFGGALVQSPTHSRTPTVAHTPSLARAPMAPRVPVMSIAMADLRAELEH
jgi:hypothetical protein